MKLVFLDSVLVQWRCRRWRLPSNRSILSRVNSENSQLSYNRRRAPGLMRSSFIFRALPLVASQQVNEWQAIRRDLLPNCSRHTPPSSKGMMLRLQPYLMRPMATKFSHPLCNIMRLRRRLPAMNLRTGRINRNGGFNRGKQMCMARTLMGKQSRNKAML
jgi:hypothetical protein